MVRYYTVQMLISPINDREIHIKAISIRISVTVSPDNLSEVLGHGLREQRRLGSHQLLPHEL